MATHYLTLIQAARQTGEGLVRLLDQLLPESADVVLDQVLRAEFKLATGLEALAAQPLSPLVATPLALSMAARAARALATIRARLDRLKADELAGR